MGIQTLKNSRRDKNYSGYHTPPILFQGQKKLRSELDRSDSRPSDKVALRAK